MQDPQAREELEQMQRRPMPSATGWRLTRRACPRPAALRNTISPPPSSCCTPTTTCRASRSQNAESIRRDIAGILHTLNQAFDNLYDNLLSDVAMDVSSEIAALQGMLANDGLTGRDFQ